MATWTKTQLAEKILTNLTVKAQGQSISAEDNEIVESFIDSAFSQLQRMNLCPFSVDAIPEWAQIPLVKYISPDVAPSFGRVLPINPTTGRPAMKDDGERDLRTQTAGTSPPYAAKAKYY